MTNEELKFILDTMTWSFTRLKSFYDCKYAWKLSYIDCVKGDNGFFDSYGSFVHEILQKYAEGQLSLFDLNTYYEEHFDESVPYDAPPNKFVNIRQSYYDKGYGYLSNIDLPIDEYEILGVEKKVRFKIDNKNFVGYIDLLLRDKKTGKIIILDHKSASLKLLKNGEVSKSDKEHFLLFKRQLYLYSIAIKEEYGDVSELWWNMFKDRKWIKIPWQQNEYDESIQWAKDTIKLIEKESNWYGRPDFFFCTYICDHRNNACEYKPMPVKKVEVYNPEPE